MTPAEIRERLKVLEALKVHPREQQVNTHLTARLERLYQEYLGEARETIGVWAAQFQRVLETQDDRQINELRKQLEQEADRFERGEW